MAMDRTETVLADIGILVFNGRGQVSLRDKTITGIQKLLFPPIEPTFYHFQLNFFHNASGWLLQDFMDEAYTTCLEGNGPNPLGFNFSPGLAKVPLWQTCTWQPNGINRTGTFHKQYPDGSNNFLSVGFQTFTSVSATVDEAYLEVTLTNRAANAVSLEVRPVQFDTNDGPVTQPTVYTIINNASQYQATVVSDLNAPSTGGWMWSLPAGSTQTARFAIVLLPPFSPQPPPVDAGIAARIAASDQASRARLAWAASRLPLVETDSRPFQLLYYRSIVSLLFCRWQRADMFDNPFYAVGWWMDMVLWDVSYASEALALLEPAAFRTVLVQYLVYNITECTYIAWNGKGNCNYWYAQTPFAYLRALQDYRIISGDLSILDDKVATVGNATVLQLLKDAGRVMINAFARPDSLLDFGASIGRFLETRTDDYSHATGGHNLLAVAYYEQIAAWCSDRNDPDAAFFAAFAARLKTAVNTVLWNSTLGWFASAFPNNETRMFMTYHMFDALDDKSTVLTPEQIAALVSHLNEEEFLAEFGMFSVAQNDVDHWDLEDVDWGGGGQYAGMPLRIIEELFRRDIEEPAWDILWRCSRWTEAFPYFPQEIFGEYLGYPLVEMPIEIAPTSGAQAVVHGVFGIRPQEQAGLVVVKPSYDVQLGAEAKLTGYRYGSHLIDVVLRRHAYEVLVDGKSEGNSLYGHAMTLTLTTLPSLKPV